MPAAFPRLYAIADKGLLGDELFDFVRDVAAAGVTLIQYRNKQRSPREILSDTRELVRICRASNRAIRLIMNDRADLALGAGFDGVHVGQDDLPVETARRICARPLIVGASTHNPAQVKTADATDADYIAIGPVFATLSKANPDPVIGLEGVRVARRLTTKPLVAIGGITRVNCLDVIAAGADSVAVISDLLHNPKHSAEAFLRLLS